MPEFLYESQKGIQPSIDNKIKKLNDAAIKCIILDSRSFGDFRTPGMQLFLAIALPGYRGPHRRTVSIKINKLYEKYCAELKKFLKTIDSISLTCDLCQMRKLHFICLTAHFFDDNFEYQSFVIGFRQVKGFNFNHNN
jgi:hypothetical protein